MTLLLYRLGRASVRRRRFVVVAWMVLAVGVLFASEAGGGKTSDEFEVPGVESQSALDLLEQDFPAAAGTSAQLVFDAGDGRSLAGAGTDAAPESSGEAEAADARADAAPASDGDAEAAGARAVADAALAQVDRQPHVGAVSELQLSPDGRVGLAHVQYDRPSEGIRTEAYDRLAAVAGEVNASGAVRLELGGELPTEASEPEFGGEEIIGLAVAMVVLLVAFGSVVAMGLPIGVALAGLLASMGLITLAAAVVDVSSVAPTIASMIGLGVGIDYALFIVTRHRENLGQGMTVEEAVGRAIATSGAAVLFAGMTVVIAISGLAIAGIPAVTVMGLTAALTVAVMVAVSLTLLPALLGFAGRRIDALRLPLRRLRGGARGAGGVRRPSLWHRWGRQVSAHPWRYLALGVVVLGLAGAPILDLRLGWPDNGSRAESLTIRRAYDLLADGFGEGSNGPLVLAVDLDDTASPAAWTAVLDRLGEAVAATPGVVAVTPAEVNDAGTTALLRVIPETSPQDPATTDLIDRLRGDVLPTALAASRDAGEDGRGATQVYLGGATATFIDMSERVTSRLPWFIGAVIALSVLLLMVVFRSIAVPLKAAVMNLLSIGAAYGVIVAVFQWGWGRSLFGLEETVPIVSFLPMMLFAILFGLSMDYEVFLLSRVREEYLLRRDNDGAVIEGIAATGRVITSAALIMISVFAAFALSDDPTVKMFGLGLATAVLVDATVVRVVLVPATMRLLGDRNWWLPGWLDRILPRLDVEGGAGLPEPEREADPSERRAPLLVG